mgnify:CR=1 FL=1
MVSLKHKVTLRRKVAQEEETENQSISSPHSAGKSSKAKIIGGLVVVAVIIAGGVFFANNGKDNDNGSSKPVTEAVAQEGEKHDADNKASAIESKDKAGVAPSDVAEEKTAANEAKPESSAADESHVTTSNEKSSVASSEKSDNNVDGDVETNARRVIRGDFGNGQVRKDRLGSSYSEIQDRVNEMYRQGLVR